MSNSNMHLLTVTLSEVRDFMIGSFKDSLEDGVTPKPVMMHSSPGVGKSSVTYQGSEAIKDFGVNHLGLDADKFRFIDVRVGAMEASEIQGVPHMASTGKINEETGEPIKEMAYSTPQWFPAEDEWGILFLDEISNAAIPNQQACYRLVLDRSIHNGSTLPKNFMIVGAGNYKADKTGAKGLIPALASRFATHFYVEANASEFIDFAIDRGLDQVVLGYIGYKGTDGLVGEKKDGEDGYPNPRNWESVSYHRKNKYHSEAMKKVATAGAVGAAAADELDAYVQYYQHLPDFEKVAQGKPFEMSKAFKETEDYGINHALATATAFQIIGRIKKEEYKEAENLTRLLAPEILDSATVAQACRIITRASGKQYMIVLAKNKSKMPKLMALVQDASQLNQQMKKEVEAIQEQYSS